MSAIVFGIAAVHFAVPIAAAMATDSRGKTWFFGAANLAAAAVIGAAAYAALDVAAAGAGLWVALSGLSRRRGVAPGAGPRPPVSTEPSSSFRTEVTPPAPLAPARAASPAYASAASTARLEPARSLPGLPHVSVRGLPTGSATALAGITPASTTPAAQPPTSNRLLLALSAMAVAALAYAFWASSSSSHPASTVTPPLTSQSPSLSSTSSPSLPRPQAVATPAPTLTAAAPLASPAPRARSTTISSAQPSSTNRGSPSPGDPIAQRQLERCLQLTDDTKMQRCLEGLP